MVDLLLSPAAPFFALAAAGAMLAAIGLLGLEQARAVVAGVRLPPGRAGVGLRLALGHAAALPLAALLLLVAAAGGASGNARTLLIGGALALYLYVGIALPRRPLARAESERRVLRRLTPGFVSYVRVALAGYDAPLALLERYVARPRDQIAPMQALVAEALQLARERRRRPFEALLTAARARGCRELTDVASALAQAEAQGSDPQTALATQEATLDALLRDEFARALKRRTLYLLGVVAISLVVGVLGNLLYVMTAGGRLLVEGGL